MFNKIPKTKEKKEKKNILYGPSFHVIHIVVYMVSIGENTCFLLEKKIEGKKIRQETKHWVV